MAMQISKTCSGDNAVGFCLRCRRRSSSSRWPLLASYRTCFCAGDTFAPKLGVLDGVPIQRFLQDAFSNKWETVVHAVGDLDSVFSLEVRRLTLLLIYLLTCVAGQMFVDNERAT